MVNDFLSGRASVHMRDEAKWRLNLFGRPTLRDSEGRSIDLPKKAFVIAARLILDKPKMHCFRGEMAEFLWSDSDALRRQTSLRTLLKRIRFALHGEAAPPIMVDDESVALDGQSLECDLIDFKRLLASGLPRDVVDASALIIGELVENCESGSAAFENWLAHQRSALSQAFLGAALNVLESDDSELPGSWKERLAQKVISDNPMDEATYRALLRIYASQHNFDGVKSTYDRLSRGLKMELGCQPSAETRALFSELVLQAEIGAVTAKGAPSRKSGGSGPGAFPTSNSQRPLLIVPSGLVSDADSPPGPLVSLVDDLLVQLWNPRALRIAVGSRGEGAILHDSDVALDDVYCLRLSLRNGECMRLSARLTHAQASDLLWAETFLVTSERYDDVVARTADAILFKIEDHQIELSQDRPCEKRTSFTLVAQAERALLRADLPSIRRGRRLLRTAVQNNSNSPRAQAGLARTFRMEWLLRAGQDANLLTNARGIARAALDTYPDSHVAHQELGMTALYQGEFSLALEHLTRARVLQPFDNSLIYDLADALIADGQAKDGIALIEKASATEFRRDEFRYWIAASGHYNLGDYKAAISELSRMKNPGSTYRLRAACEGMLGQKDLAEHFRIKSIDEQPDFDLEEWLSLVPMRLKVDHDHFREGCKLAGFR
jgi:DNA-binding SARP family transcriptional activator